MNGLHRHTKATAFRGLRRLCLATVLVVTTLASTPAPAPARQPGATLEFEAPRQAEVGVPFEIVLRVNRASDIAGYEAVVLFDTTAAEFSGLRQRDNDLKRIGRDVTPVVVPELSNGVAIGLYSCPVENCVTRQGPRQDRGAQGMVRLARLIMVANAPGPLELRMDAVKFVDANGNSLAVDVPNPTITVDITGEGDRADHGAPGSMWSLGPPSNTPPGPFDLTGDGQVTHADAIEVALEWNIARLDQAPCGDNLDLTRDINHDGCIDVADMQLVAANYSPQTQSTLGRPGPGRLRPPSTAGAQGSTFTVNATADGADANKGNGVCATSAGFCTLRAAIEEANAHPGPDSINFNIFGSGVKTIQLVGRLPTINDLTGPTTIDGYTQAGASPNSDAVVSNAAIRIQVRGNGPDRHDGIVISSSGNVIKGLALFNLRRSMWIFGSGARSNVIEGNFIGTDAAGTARITTLVTGAHGVHAESGASQNRFGGTSPAARNIISGSGQSGLGIWHENSDGNIIQNNILGLNPAGNNRLPNMKHGVDLNFGSSGNTVGGTGAGERNVMSGNEASGIEVSHSAGTTKNNIIGNYVGTDVTGQAVTAWSHNTFTGLTLEDGVIDNTIAHNVIGGNKQGGLTIVGATTQHNKINDNFIGRSPNGTPIGNSLFGVRADGRLNMIGPSNVIAHNQFTGVVIREAGSDGNTITRNSIFANGALGIDLLPNGVTPNDPGDGDSGPNEQLNFPVISRATTTQVTGTACGGCTVEVFVADSGPGAHGEGQTYLGSATAAGNGAFTLNISDVAQGAAVTSTATDSAGNTSEFSANVQVSDTQGEPPPGGGTTVAEDRFERTVTDGWGSADIGGPYTLLFGSSAKNDFDVAGGAGTVVIGAANLGREAMLDSVSVQDTVIRVLAKTNRLPEGDSQHILLAGRRMSTSTMYRVRIRLLASGQVELQANRGVDGVWATLSAALRVSDVAYTPDSYLQVHAQMVGTNPTTIRINVWPEGQLEPADWQYSVTDSHAALQASGSVGLRVFLASNAPNAPVTFTFDDLVVTGP